MKLHLISDVPFGMVQHLEDHRTLTCSHQRLGNEESGQSDPVKIFEMSKGGQRKLFHKTLTSQLPKLQHALLYILLLALSGASILQIIASVFSARVATDRAALWSSKKCGIWMFDDQNAGPYAASCADLFNCEKGSRAADYAYSCYGDLKPGDPTECEFFYSGNITYSEPSYSYECSFPSKDVCAPSTQSVTFDTGIEDVSVLGINSPTTDKFRRRTTCSSLHIGSPFVATTMRNGTTTTSTSLGVP